MEPRKTSYLNVAIKCAFHFEVKDFLPPDQKGILPIPSLEEQIFNLPVSGEISSLSNELSFSLIKFEGHAVHALNIFRLLIKRMKNQKYTFVITNVQNKEDLGQNFLVYEKKYKCQVLADCTEDEIKSLFKKSFRSVAILEQDKGDIDSENLKNKWFDDTMAEKIFGFICNSLCKDYFGNIFIILSYILWN